MKVVDLQTWSRAEHFKMFSEYDNPDLTLCANVDITPLYKIVKHHNLSINLTLLYLLTRVANHIEEFCYRVLDGNVVIYDVLHPSTTVLGNGDLFGFCRLSYNEDFSTFHENAKAAVATARDNPSLSPIDSQATLYFTTIPWISFTSITHPVKVHPVDAIPRISLGKFIRQGETILLPLSVQVHHGLMDGIHVGRFYQSFEELVKTSNKLFS